MSNGSYISDIRASCTVPMLNVTGRLPIKLSVNGGTSFDFEGIFASGNSRYCFCTKISADMITIHSQVDCLD